MNIPVIDSKKLKKVYVWNNGVRPEIPKKRYPIYRNKNGSIICVNIRTEKAFLSGDKYEPDHWNHYKEIPEPKMEPMTFEDIAKLFYCDSLFIKGTVENYLKYDGYSVADRQVKIGGEWHEVSYIIDTFKYTKDKGKTWHEFKKPVEN